MILPSNASIPNAAKEFLEAIADEILPVELPAEQTQVEVAALPFYEDVKLYALTDTSTATAERALCSL